MTNKITISGIAFAAFFLNLNASDRPNIIWLMAEDISNDLECYGTRGVKTPVLNKLADEGLRFTNCISSNPICSPNRSSMMTGVHQLKINAHHHRSNVNLPLPEGYKPFTYWLRESGYTCILGSHLVRRSGRKTDCNFKHTPLGEYDGITKFGLFDKYDTITAADQPFFAQIQMVTTHRGDWWSEVREASAHPVNPDLIELPPFLADHPVIRLDWAKYLDQVEYIDHEIGLIIKDLKAKGIYENTILIFIGDNGRCNIRGKGFLHDSGIRVPLIVHRPGHLKPKVRKDLVSTTDITATILDFAGIEIPEYMTGKSFISKDFRHEYIFSARDSWDEILEKSRSLTGQRYKYIRNDSYDKPYDRFMAYTEFYRPALHIMRKLKMEDRLSSAEEVFFVPFKAKEELYDLKKDPFELNNLAGNPSYAKLLAELRAKLSAEEAAMTPSVVRYEHTPGGAPAVLEWVKQTKPELYRQMLEGVEIGYQRLSEEFRRSGGGLE
jgi:arylsulfatase A-like enzyme